MAAPQKWLESIDVPLVREGGLMDGAATFCCYNTADSLCDTSSRRCWWH